MNVDYDTWDRLALAWTVTSLALIILALGLCWLIDKIVQHRRGATPDPRRVNRPRNCREIRADDFTVTTSAPRFAPPIDS